MDNIQLQQAIFGLHTRRFGTVAEIMIKKIIRAESSEQLSFDLFDKFDGSIVEDNKWRVTGSNGNHYWVEWHPFHKHYSCGCKGYSFRKTCRHIKELSEEFRKNLFNKGV